LDDLIGTVVRKQASAQENAQSEEKVNIAISTKKNVDALLQEIMNSCEAKQQNDIPMLTSHERAVRRQIVKDFMSACLSCNNCANCGAFSPKLRQDNYNKIFQAPLSDKNKRNNLGQNIRILPASTMLLGDDSLVPSDENDSDVDHGSDDEDIDNDEVRGHSTMSDDEEDDMDDGLLTSRKKQRKSTVLVGSKKSSSAQEKAASKASKPDKFMHALEVEAQVKLTWQMEPLLCGKVFGSAHCRSGPDDLNGYTIFFMRTIPVPPSRFRPPMVMGTMTVEHAQNHYLNKVLGLNDRLRMSFSMVQGFEEKGDLDDTNEGKELVEKMDKDGILAKAISIWIELQTTVNCFIDSSKDPSAAAAKDLPNGIRQLLEKKEGIFRKHMMGKRVNFACRSVISPDPYIGTNEIGIPLYFAKTLTYPAPVTALNVAEMRNLVIRGPNQYPGARWVELPNGRRIDLTRMQQTKREAIAARLLSSNGIATVGRQLQNGDMVLMNRQVSLLGKLRQCKYSFASREDISSHAPR
jgi:DNA-directed RNA polymerase I subunit RPA1